MWINLARVHDLVDLDDRNTRRLGEAGIEVLCTAAELTVPHPVGALRGHEGVVDADSGFEDERLAIEEADLLALGDGRSHAGGCVDASQTGAASAQALDQSALRHDFVLDLARCDPIACR